MKILKTLALISFIGISAIVPAQVITTLQHNGATTVYYNQNGLVDAYNASVAGDTIYLSGGHFTAVNINKRLHIFGAGYFPDSTVVTGITYIDAGFEIQAQADSAQLQGLNINGNVSFQNDAVVSYVRFSRNYVNGSINFPGSRSTPCKFVTIDGNVITSTVELNNALQCDISNNFIQSVIYYGLNCSIRNNIFHSGSSYGWPYYSQYSVYDCDNCLIENNIFITSNMFFYCDNSLARNNVLSGAPLIVSGSVTLTSNYNNTNMSSFFVNASSTSFSYTENYHLQNAGAYAGSDGTEAGIYGYAFPFKAGAVPKNPHIRSAVIPANTDASGNLNISIKASAQQN